MQQDMISYQIPAPQRKTINCFLIPSLMILIRDLYKVATAPGPKYSVCWYLIILEWNLNQYSRLI